jgi:hypothetical protein
MEQSQRLPVENQLRIARDRRYAANIDYMRKMVDRLVKERREAADGAASKGHVQSICSQARTKKWRAVGRSKDPLPDVYFPDCGT